MEPEAWVLLQLIGDPVDARLCAGLIAGLAVSAHTDCPDRIVADVDRNSAAERDYLPKHGLAGSVHSGFGSLGPFQRWAAERARRVGFAASELQAVRRGIVGGGADPPPDRQL